MKLILYGVCQYVSYRALLCAEPAMQLYIDEGWHFYKLRIILSLREHTLSPLHITIMWSCLDDESVLT